MYQGTAYMFTMTGVEKETVEKETLADVQEFVPSAIKKLWKRANGDGEKEFYLEITGSHGELISRDSGMVFVSRYSDTPILGRYWK